MEKLLNAILYFLLLMAVDCWPFDEDPVTVPNAPVTARVGESVILPCHLSAEISSVEKEVRWYRVRNNKVSIVLNYATKKSIPEMQSEEYSDRVSFFIQEIDKGKASLQMKNTAFSDKGEYKCCVISDNVHCKIVKLLVPAHGRKPIITVHKQPGGEIRLKCESKGWYPKPELHWNYGDGSVVPVHPDFSEKVEEDGRITVTSHLSVQDSYEEDFLCIVQLSDSKEKFVSTFHVSVKLKTSESMCLSEINKNVILPCHLDPAVRVLDSEVKWEKRGLTSPVFLYTNRRVALEEHHEQYKERTQLNSQDKRTGDLSLLLKNVKVTDEGRYICSVKAHGREIQASLDLSVTAQGGKPVITKDEEPGKC
ncbi:butyrophilin-like protein 2 isoform X2 [Polypterus senegalus]|nr:butyrophilin-like protein 2 isoform X2 [Polypterus senegalus]